MVTLKEIIFVTGALYCELSSQKPFVIRNFWWTAAILLYISTYTALTSIDYRFRISIFCILINKLDTDSKYPEYLCRYLYLNHNCDNIFFSFGKKITGVILNLSRLWEKSFIYQDIVLHRTKLLLCKYNVYIGCI